MAAAPVPPFVSVDEYLHADYEHDMDYVDGVLEERDLGEYDHSNLQTELAVLFRNHRNEWRVKAVVEQRVQVGPTRFRVPDVCVMDANWKPTPIVTMPPLLCIEVLSPENRMRRMRIKCQDYLSMGVPVAWIFDPAKREVLVLTPGTDDIILRQGSLHLQGTLIEISVEEVFRVLDEE